MPTEEALPPFYTRGKQREVNGRAARDTKGLASVRALFSTAGMRRISLQELRFSLKFALGQLSRALLRDLAGKPDRREAALDRAADALVHRLRDHEVYGPVQDSDMDFGLMGNSSRDERAQ